MKLFLTAIALAFAAPAMAQTATADPHAGHNMAAQQTAPAADPCTPEHAAMGHCTPKAAAAPAGDHHAGHDMKGSMPSCDKGPDGKMACCEKMKAEGKKMDCCAKMGGKTADAQSGHSGH
ncbi:hypothetical protein E2493_09980 [Sphingomonas parva]|uniref:Pentapeptide MXKDX repeat protein n=1 Tax=Sphingomonas parva TaxID=2555898 RepID=A0A4Y8ZR15_9SPHN|nr:hypothetical protein [Sphingomonas parva]TFI58451.1 hypothetical protein E2493_09980 [Sphingomonas parva]